MIYQPSSKEEYRLVKINTIQSPSWVAWKEIQIETENSTPIDEPNSEDASLKIYPNPTTDKLTFQYFLNKPSRVKIAMLYPHGGEVKIIYDDQSGAGLFLRSLDKSELAISPGVYFIKFSLGDRILIRKVVLI